MATDESRIDELDLQAYADGRLDRDPHRKAVVEIVSLDVVSEAV